jgi:3-isopropylmalate/(R)-2-methylmalate dehydratase small subunit
MEKFTELTGIGAPMLMANINTDLIAPTLMPGHTPEQAAEMSLREKMFANLRFAPDGTPRQNFVLNKPRYQGARIILAGPNFGCGSSRETAVWSLMEAGIRCVIAPSFGDIFNDNSYQNGLLPLILPMATIERIAEALDRSNSSEMTIDLRRGLISVPGVGEVPFNLPEDRRIPLVEGRDQLDVIMQRAADIDAFETKDAAMRPWVYGGGLS